LAGSLHSQNLEGEVGFKYVKAEYLMDTERVEDAIKELNEVISKSPSYKNALYLRALAKYKLAAYKGAKADLLQHIEVNGVTMQAINLLAKSDYAMKSFDAALNSLDIAAALGDKDEKIYEMKAQIHFDRGEMMKACETWEQAVKLGSTNATLNARRYCGMKQEPKKTEPPVVVNSDNNQKEKEETTETNTNNNNNDGKEIGNNTDTTKNNGSDDLVAEEEEDERNVLLEDNTVNSIVIDEDLSIEIFGQGLGIREIIDRPSILILAEQDGEVAVEICVNDRGKVTYAEFYPAKSTLAQKSMVSLAIRKAKEFWFEKSDLEKQCGYMIFKIKAG
jgi:tetratricopeptide (TPR) repeat protein